MCVCDVCVCVWCVCVYVRVQCVCVVCGVRVCGMYAVCVCSLVASVTEWGVDIYIHPDKHKRAIPPMDQTSHLEYADPVPTNQKGGGGGGGGGGGEGKEKGRGGEEKGGGKGSRSAFFKTTAYVNVPHTTSAA